MLAIIIEHTKNDRQIEGVVPHLVDGGLYLLQYVDDMILFMEHDTERDLFFLLSALEKLSKFKINLHKLEFSNSVMFRTRLPFMPNF
jgi:hypothetical protein